ncbi:MAG: hypothetical protein LQ344_000530 [Seirophora lacunosa]|nr:MAG: hypothetical protein LQ344_000530 [Seirophora lacunosa]
MPKNLAKVQKKIAKKKGNVSSLHENSRDARRLRRAGARSEKLEKLAAARGRATQPLLQRIAFFQTAAQESSEPFNISSIQGLIDIYLARDSTELSTLQASRRSGRPTSTREDTLKQQMDAEAKEYVSGLWLPDMEDPETVEKLKDWSGEWMNLNTLKFARALNSELLLRKGLRDRNTGKTTNTHGRLASRPPKDIKLPNKKNMIHHGGVPTTFFAPFSPFAPTQFTQSTQSSQPVQFRQPSQSTQPTQFRQSWQFLHMTQLRLPSPSPPSLVVVEESFRSVDDEDDGVEG